jgi:hypothetical protein
MKKIIEIFLALLIIAFSIILIFKWENRSDSVIVNSNSNKTEDLLYENEMKIPQFVSTEEIASLFGWEKKAPEPSVSIIKKKTKKDNVKSTSWIKYLGHIIESGGKKYYFFKNTSNNDLFSLRYDSNYGGWKLLSTTDEGFILEYENDKYFVEKE